MEIPAAVVASGTTSKPLDEEVVAVAFARGRSAVGSNVWRLDARICAEGKRNGWDG